MLSALKGNRSEEFLGENERETIELGHDPQVVEFYQQGWRAFCQHEDCDEFPRGFVTVDLAAERYYFPFDATRGQPQPLGNVYPVASIAEGNLRDFDDTDLMVRSYRRAVVINLYGSFIELIEWSTGEKFGLPRSTGTYVFATLRQASSIGEFHRAVSNITTLEWPSGPSGFLEMNPIRVSESFFLVHQTHPEFGNLYYAVVSAGPIFHGNWIVGRCRSGECTFTVWPTEMQKQENEIVLVLENYRFTVGSTPPDCANDLRSDQANCKEARETLELVPVVFDKIEQLLEFLSQKPSAFVGNE